ncbi:MAG: hypothetical protein FKGGLIKP_00563 [Sodalis sp. Fse]|nr:MAG: hypothetical protein FKGGLIKP_00563 [Sodalis sp. Fse]
MRRTVHQILVKTFVGIGWAVMIDVKTSDALIN